MTGGSRRWYDVGFWVLLAVVTVGRLWLIGRFGLSADEAHYALYARHLAWGYVDHPPMVAILIALTSLFGEGPFAIRTGAVVCSVLVLVLVRALAREVYHDERLPFWALVVLLLMPYYHALSIAALPDATLSVFWCGAVLAFWHAVKSGAWRPWLLAGAAFGGALLSKYHGVLLPVCFAGFLLAGRNRRRWLLRPHPYVALGLGLALFLPNVLWNARHDWISYAYQLSHGGKVRGLDWLSAAEVVGGQMAAASPLLPLLVAGALVNLVRTRPLRVADQFALWMSMPVFLFFCGVGMFGKILPHWPFVGWWTATLMLVAVVLRQFDWHTPQRKRWARWCAASAGISILLLGVLYLALFRPVLAPLHAKARALSLALHGRFDFVKPLEPFKNRHDVSNDLYGWDVAADRVRQEWCGMARPEKTFVFCHAFYPASQLGVHLHPDLVVTTLSRRPNQYKLWFLPHVHAGWDALFVDEDYYLRGPAAYRDVFERIDEEPVEIVIERGKHRAHTLRIYRCYGFKPE